MKHEHKRTHVNLKCTKEFTRCIIRYIIIDLPYELRESCILWIAEDIMDRSLSTVSTYTKEDFDDKDETDIYLFLIDSGFEDNVAKVFESECLILI